MHNLSTVFKFEVIRTLKKRSFWVMALLLPTLIGAVFAIIYFSGQATKKAETETANQQFSIAVTDHSGLLSPRLLAATKASIITDKQTGIDEVKTGQIDAYFYYPQDISKDSVQVYAHDVGLFDNNRYEAVAKLLLQQAALSKVSPKVAATLQDKVGFTSTTYKDGRPYDDFQQLIAPGVFLVLFYLLIAMFGNQMLTSTTEEKENRVIEMILTTIQARTLIIGKILSLIVLALIQICIILIPTIIIYVLFHNKMDLPSVDLSHIPLDPIRIALGAAIFTLSFLMFTGILVAIGAASPTAKEASGFFGSIMILIFGPLYAVTLFISQPTSSIVRFLTFFPLTAPIPLMLRNAVGNLSVHDAIIALVILAVSAVVALFIAVRMFRYGALEYSRRLTLSAIFARKR